MSAQDAAELIQGSVCKFERLILMRQEAFMQQILKEKEELRKGFLILMRRNEQYKNQADV